MDKDGHSDESSEGMVANHDPFRGVQDAIEKQDDFRKDQQDPFTPTSTDNLREELKAPEPKPKPKVIPPVEKQQQK